jgi:hypothetical protein
MLGFCKSLVAATFRPRSKMAEFIPKTEGKFSGPWLLDRAALGALDDIIKEQWSRLEAYRQREIDAKVLALAPYAGVNPDLEQIRERARSDYSGDSRRITLTVASGHGIRVASFREAMDDVSCQTQRITKITVTLNCGGISGDIVVPTADFSQSLSIIALPEASEPAVELFIKLNRWADDYKPHWLRKLRGLAPPLIWMLALLIVIAVLVIGMVTGSYSETEPLNESIRALVAKGIKPEDYGHALELLLRLSPVYPKQFIMHYAKWMPVAAAAIAIIAALLSVQARTAFELGSGSRSVQRQKTYDSFLRWTIPAFFFVDVLAAIFAAGLLRYLGLS